MKDSSEKTAGSDLRARIDDAAEAVSETAREQASEAAGRVAARAGDTVGNAADAAAAARSEFEPGTLQAQAADQMAAGLQQVAGALRDTDLNSAAGEVTRFARENPLLFLGGTALLGFAAVRFLKASDRQGPAPQARTAGDPWTGHVSTMPAGSPAYEESDTSYTGERGAA
ncbi:hypothetical protein [uncultured Roseobacter sp.]|uniref:hypothetical protein n=1 Tax=uncultured Roseobacter sp. TaxID=114847 RepID=UPI0026057494|nr:hypothetical protein [uncultured Roseobacter sp.]